MLALVVTWPLALHPHLALFGGIDGVADRFAFVGHEEAWLHLWHIWWVNQALRQGHNPFWTPLLFYPEGVQLYIQTLAIPNALMTLPVYAVAGPVAAYNAVIVLSLVLTGYGTFVLSRAYVPGWFGPFLSGALLTFGPFHLGQLQNSHVNLFSFQWIPLYLHALTLLDRRGGWPRIGYAAITASLVVLADWYWALTCGMLTVVWMLVQLTRAADGPALARRYGLFASTTLAVMAPFLVGLAQSSARLPFSDTAPDPIWQAYIRGSSTDLLGLAFPNVYNPLWGSQVESWLSSISSPFAPSGWYVAAGWTVLILGAIGIWRYGRNKAHVLATALVLWLMSLGPSLRVGGMDTGIPMPYTLLEAIPVLSVARKPAMFAAGVLPLLSVFAALGLHTLQLSLSGRWRVALHAAVTLLAFLELQLPPGRVFLTPEQATVYSQIASQPGVVADLPLDQQETSRTLRNQLVHGQPIVGGYIARRPRYESFMMPLLNQIGLMHVQPQVDIVRLDREALAAMQCYAPVRHVVIRTDLTTPREQQNLQQLLSLLANRPIAPANTDARHQHYILPLMADSCRVFTYLGAGWYDLEYAHDQPFRWLSDSSDLWLVNPFDQPVLVQLTLTAEAFRTARPLTVSLAERPMVRFEIAPSTRSYAWLVTLPPGSTRLTLHAPTTFDEVSNRHLSIVVRQIRVYECK
ncbi:MAG: hypothetical protein SNJ69_12150 [Chloroflexaceae bacterium]